MSLQMQWPGALTHKEKLKLKNDNIRKGSEVPEKDVAELEGNSSQRVQAGYGKCGSTKV